MSNEQELRDEFAAAALTGIIAASDDSEIKQPQAEFLARQAWLAADAMLRERDRACDAKPRELSDDQKTLRNAADVLGPGGFKNLANELLSLSRRLTNHDAAPATWQDECADVEAAFARSGVRPTWPDDEPANIGPMAHAMADEIARLRITDAERAFLKLHRERLVWWAHSSKESAAELETVNGLLARLGGDA